MIENEIAKFEKPPIVRKSSCAYPKLPRSCASLEFDSSMICWLTCKDSQVEGFWAGQLLIAENTECTASPGVLHASPCQFGIQVVTTVHKPCACLNLISDS